MKTEPRLIFWEITKKCNLTCSYCRRQSSSNMKFSDRTKADCFSIIDSITESCHPLLIFSGGEPLLYPHIFEVASYARAEGLKTALATNAALIDNDAAKKIKSTGFHRVAVSLDGAKEGINDSLRPKGAFFKTLAGIQSLKSYAVPLQINTTVFRKNYKDISSMYRLCLDLGVEALHIFAFVPTGCGMSIPKNEMLTEEEYEEFLSGVADLSLTSAIEIRLTCAPQYQRILARRKDNPVSKMNKGCLAGTAVCFISAEAEVYPCGYLPVSAGNILTKPFKEIWQESDLFQSLRAPNLLKGKCGVCEYIDLCGGCRARAYAATGDFLREEPECVYQPLTAKS